MRTFREIESVSSSSYSISVFSLLGGFFKIALLKKNLSFPEVGDQSVLEIRQRKKRRKARLKEREKNRK